MDAIADIPQARRALRLYLSHAQQALPADTLSSLEGFADSPSPVDQIAGSAELLYARRDELDDEGRVPVGQLAGFAALNGWHDMSVGNRGGMILQAMKRDMGLKREAGQSAYPRADADPAPLERHLRSDPPAVDAQQS